MVVVKRVELQAYLSFECRKLATLKFDNLGIDCWSSSKFRISKAAEQVRRVDESRTTFHDQRMDRTKDFNQLILSSTIKPKPHDRQHSSSDHLQKWTRNNIHDEFTKEAYRIVLTPFYQLLHLLTGTSWNISLSSESFFWVYDKPTYKPRQIDPKLALQIPWQAKNVMKLILKQRVLYDKPWHVSKF